MKKLIVLIILLSLFSISRAGDRTLSISTGYTMLNNFSLNASDTINASDTVTFTILNPQKYFQHQTFTVGLEDVSGTPAVTITAYGKVTSSGSWVQIGTPISWTSDSNDGDITSTTPNNYNYLKVEFIASGTTQQTKIDVFQVKTANCYDIPANSGTLTVSRATSGAVTITTKDDDANAATTYRAGGTGALTIGAPTGTTAIISSDWAVSAAGVITGLGDVTSDGVITGGFKLLAPVLNTDGTETLTAAQSGKMIVCSKDSISTITLPDPSAGTVGVVYYILQTVNQDLKVVPTTADGNSIVCDGVATSDAVTISTSSHKIGAGMIVIGISATQWYIGGLNPESVLTPEAAD